MIRLQDEAYKICGDGLCLIHSTKKECDHLKIKSVLRTKESSYRIVGFTHVIHILGANVISFDESSEIEAVPLTMIRKCRSVFIFPPKIKRVFVGYEYNIFNYHGSCCPKIEPGESDQRFVSINGYRVVMNHFPLEIACQLSARHRFCLRETTRFVGDRSFFVNENIRTVIIPSSVEYIGNSAFERCYQLRFIIFKNNSRLKRIGKYSFSDTHVESIEIPSSVEEIGDGSFFRCNNLRSVTFPEDSKIKRIGYRSFESTAIESICIPSNVEEIGDEAFIWCHCLRSFSYQGKANIKRMGRDVFIGCPFLDELH